MHFAGVVCLVICTSLVVVISPFLSGVSADGMLDLCREHQPDGTAILETSPGQSEVLAIFRGNHVWLVSLSSFVNIINGEGGGPNATNIFSRANALDASAIFPQLSPGLKRVVGFSSLNSSHQFYNNILVFTPHQVSRYKVTSIKVSDHPVEPGELSATLEGTFDTHYWPRFESDLSDLRTAYIIRGTRLLVFLQSSARYGPKTIYQLNRNNLANPNPLQALGRLHHIPHQDKALFVHNLESDKENPTRMFFLLGGRVCLNEGKCINLMDLVECNNQIERYISGFSYWVQYNTQLTFRLVAVALSAAMLASSFIAIVLTINQLNKVFLLT